eukprot:768818-Hanusia_phi.AAC.15
MEGKSVTGGVRHFFLGWPPCGCHNRAESVPVPAARGPGAIRGYGPGSGARPRQRLRYRTSEISLEHFYWRHTEPSSDRGTELRLGHRGSIQWQTVKLRLGSMRLLPLSWKLGQASRRCQ